MFKNNNYSSSKQDKNLISMLGKSLGSLGNLFGIQELSSLKPVGTLILVGLGYLIWKSYYKLRKQFVAHHSNKKKQLGLFQGEIINLSTMGDKQPLDVLVIGAGFSGMCAAIKLREQGFNVTILEKSDKYGGTWHQNSYPGVQCDVPAHLYSFSFMKNENWSKPFAPGPEIHEYAENVAKAYRLKECTRFGFNVAEAYWDEENCVWHVKSEDGEKVTARIAIFAVGPLHVPNFPDFPGQEKFEGITMHSAQWDENKDLTGKDVVVFGSAASAIQLIPPVAEKAKSVYVMQRTPNWVAPQGATYLPDPEKGYPTWLRNAFQYVPGLISLHRLLIFINMEILSWPLHILSAPPDGKPMFGQQLVKRYVTEHMLDQIKNDKTGTLKDKVIPNFPLGCKRILRSDKYLKCIAENDHVHLVTSGVKEITSNEVLTNDGQRIHADAIIYATGFKVGSIGKCIAKGTGDDCFTGTDLIDQGREAYLGAAMKNFPNSFVMVGPNTGLGHNSIILMIESQMKYISGILNQMRARKVRRIEIKDEAMKRFYDYVWKTMDSSVWTANHCSSWYQNKDGKVVTLWPATTIKFDQMASNPNLGRDFDVQKIGSNL